MAARYIFYILLYIYNQLLYRLEWISFSVKKKNEKGNKNQEAKKEGEKNYTRRKGKTKEKKIAHPKYH